MQTVVETPAYLADAERLFTTEERELIVELLAADPHCGVVDEKSDLSPSERTMLGKSVTLMLADYRRRR